MRAILNISNEDAHWADRKKVSWQRVTHRTTVSVCSRDRQNRGFTNTGDFHFNCLITKPMKLELL